MQHVGYVLYSALVASGVHISNSIPSETGCEDSGDLESEESMDSTDGPEFFYDDKRVVELEKKVSTLTQQL